MHLVAWEDVCRQKEEGGLGLRSSRLQNKAFMMKLGWGMANKHDALWVKFLREKYRRGTDIMPKVERRKEGSQVWKGISQAWESVLKGLEWTLGDGVKIKFWEDSWLPRHEKLKSYVSGNIENSMLNDTVADYVDENGSWQWHKFASLLPSSVLNTMERMHPYVRKDPPDSVKWWGAKDGNLSVRFAYQILACHTLVYNMSGWRKLWKLQVPQRCRMFL